MREQDVLYRFLIENADVRGVLVRLDETWMEALSRTQYPASVQLILGQAMVAVATLSASLKFTGKLTLQVTGDGPLNLLVVQVTQDGKLRGMADWSAVPPEGPLSAVFGQAQMSISITGTQASKEYQGLVEIVGDSLSDALREYFVRSEQLDTEMWMSVSPKNASCLLLQKLPGRDRDEADDDWNRLVALAETTSDEEMSALMIEELLHRLFHEDEVRLFDAEELCFECSCSRERVGSLIKGLGLPEAKSILEDQGQIEVTCEFCNSQHQFDAVDVAALFTSLVDTSSPESPTQH